MAYEKIYYVYGILVDPRNFIPLIRQALIERLRLASENFNGEEAALFTWVLEHDDDDNVDVLLDLIYMDDERARWIKSELKKIYPSQVYTWTCFSSMAYKDYVLGVKLGFSTGASLNYNITTVPGLSLIDTEETKKIIEKIKQDFGGDPQIYLIPNGCDCCP